MDELITKISELIVDYADGEFGRLDEAHVRRWINQFDEDDREVVLAETNRILKRTYITKETFTNFIANLVKSPTFSTEEQVKFWSSVSLCNIQIKGHSQRELVSLFKDEVLSTYGVEVNINTTSSNYIYVDDFLFSGGRLVSDLRKWIEESAPQKCTVRVVVMGWYHAGKWYVQNQLPKIAEQHKKDINFEFWSIEDLRLENRLAYRNKSHVFWPVESVMDFPEVQAYIRNQSRAPTHRVSIEETNKVFSKKRRNQYEIAMTKAGLKIIGFCNEPNSTMKPLGYNRFDGFGFGSTIFSFRNCPNNNPLAFWWGDSSYSETQTLGKWYPLMQRKTYG